MSESRTMSAQSVSWEAPGGIPMSLITGDESTLMVTIEAGAVLIGAAKCRWVVGDPHVPTHKVSERDVVELRITVPLERCQIIWHSE